jgi:dTDP-4-amino-4,6-dideoxygalactose transaminase
MLDMHPTSVATPTAKPSYSIPLTQPALDDAEVDAMLKVLQGAALAGDGAACRRVEAVLREVCGVNYALLTTSCTHALELALLALGIGPGDEVILPSFTFTSTANAVAIRGAKPVFVDINPNTWNMEPQAVEAAITPRTRCIMPVHYAGQGCDMPALTALAEQHGLWMVEDAAQAIGACFDERPLGAWGDFGCLSFHNTKNIVCGEGGALLTNDRALAHRAEIMREKGTNRAAFFRGEVDKYTWVDIGSSYVISDVLAALLEVQLRKVEQITQARGVRWMRYQEAFQALEQAQLIQRPYVAPQAAMNWHLYGFLVNAEYRDEILAFLRSRGVGATFHTPIGSVIA